MSIFHGYAELDLSPGNSIQGTASLDLTENVIKVDFFHPSIETPNSFNIKLKKVCVLSPFGEMIFSDCANNFFAKYIQGKTMSVYDSYLRQAFQLKKECATTKITFCPKMSKVPVIFKNIVHPSLAGHYIFFENSQWNFPRPIDFRLKDKTLVVNSDLNIFCEKELSDEEIEIFRIAWSLLEGQNLMERVNLWGEACLLNLMQVKEKGISSLVAFNFSDVTNAVDFVQKTLNYTCALQPDEREKFFTSVNYFLHGIKNTGSIDHKIMMLIKFIEIVDGTYTMRWEKTRELFDISESDAELLQEIRNSLFHSPESLDQALRNKAKKLKNPDLQIFSIKPDSFDNIFTFQLTLCNLCVKYWSKLIGYNGPTIDFMKIMNY